MPTHRISHREDSRNAPPRYHDHAVGNGPPPNLARHHYPMNGGKEIFCGRDVCENCRGGGF